ncbi:hypothetical protein GUITHDRAFT_121759 [Guillardia theta CCMP2712]|uniref:Uncharacterized protein n=1 Tax=Guillardia theta (strain CCMP2712) TaxID=905079 RepID=L1I828_GUITC|nr:hypothetical protein GUITHDRAFT_121759 [Guillardia theta CCMP2712]EKX32059.1 hypothetical protein GUITHDRAFT_121759 [Guillardia theta CCMP2712]|eukprot:XP_005819039.1 hypothetical protein GUITHDRAFT_121759 [Guillardia theta CCMP2712]
MTAKQLGTGRFCTEMLRCHLILFLDRSAAVLENNDLSTAEKLSFTVKIHFDLCGLKHFNDFQDRLDQIAEQDFLQPLLELCQIQHALSYVSVRLLGLFTMTSKSTKALIDLSVLDIMTTCLRRQNEWLCIRFIVEIIYTICQSDLIKTRAALEQISRLDASILLSFANPFQVELDAATVIPSDDTLPGFGRQAMMKAGALFSILDLLSQHKRGMQTLTVQETLLLHRLKSTMLFWESLVQTRLAVETNFLV